MTKRPTRPERAIIETEATRFIAVVMPLLRELGAPLAECVTSEEVPEHLRRAVLRECMNRIGAELWTEAELRIEMMAEGGQP